MAAYYNEIDKYAVKWLRNLIDAGHIAPGIVDDRSIKDVQPGDLDGFTQCHFFAGIGVWSYALRLAEWPDNRPVWTGSCPCQPFSAAGKGNGFEDDRHLWPDFKRLIAECQPPAVVGEQVSGAAAGAWLDSVFVDLEALDYACGAVAFPAASVGEPHIRERTYWLAHSNSHRLQRRLPGRQDAQQEIECRPPGPGCATDDGRPSLQVSFWRDADWLYCKDVRNRPVEPRTFPLVDWPTIGLGNMRSAKIKAYGNAIVPQQAALFIQSAMDCI